MIDTTAPYSLPAGRAPASVAPAVRRIGTEDIRASLAAGWDDFRARPTTAIFLIVVYPLIGLLLYRFAFQQDLLPLLFPIASGFALVGPIAAAGVYDLSRTRETGRGELDGVDAIRHGGQGRMVPLALVGLVLLGLYLAWIAAAYMIWGSIMGEYRPATLQTLATDVVGTGAGWALIALGCGVGFLFALAALAIGTFSLPAIVDRGLGAGEAINLSVRAFAANPATMLVWGAVVTAALVAGSVPLFLGLTVALPVLGHATWHLYRRVAA